MEGSKEGRPSWARDGKYLYFRSDRDGVPRIWKMRAGGEASGAVAITGRDAYEAMESLDRSRHIVVMCRSGKRSLTAAKQLNAAGFSHVTNLAGGILRWSADVDPKVPTY